MTPYIADAARAILRQFNGLDVPDYKFWGPHFVTYSQGTFFLKPFGACSRYRYSFLVIPEFIPGIAEPFWIFNVL